MCLADWIITALQSQGAGGASITKIEGGLFSFFQLVIAVGYIRMGRKVVSKLTQGMKQSSSAKDGVESLKDR